MHRCARPLFAALLLAALLVGASAAVVAADAAVTRSLSRMFPDGAVLSASTGEIGGIRRIAAIITDPHQLEMALVVLSETAPGQLAVSARSATFSMHHRWHDVSWKVRNDSLHFEVSGNGGCCYDYSHRYQFRMRDGQFVLVGSESTEMGFEPSRAARAGAAGEPLPVLYRSGLSTNLVSGSAVQWRVEALSPTADPFKDDILKLKAGRKRTEKTVRITPKRVMLEGFSP